MVELASSPSTGGGGRGLRSQPGLHKTHICPSVHPREGEGDSEGEEREKEAGKEKKEGPGHRGRERREQVRGLRTSDPGPS